MTRTVVVLCGPPGSGKTTAARQSGLEVYDRDDWSDKALFFKAVEALASAPSAAAVVIRSAPSSWERKRAAQDCGATHTFLLLESRDELARRITRRGRSDKARTHAGLNRWFKSFDDLDHVERFPGWEWLMREGLSTTEAW